MDFTYRFICSVLGIMD